MEVARLKRLTLVAAAAGIAAASCSASFSAEKRHDLLVRRLTLPHDGVERSYVLRTPSDLAERSGPVPLVLVLHGGGGNAASAQRITGFSEKAEEEGFIVVYPEGSGRIEGRFLTWNADHCCGHAMRNRVDDVGFISALIDRTLRDYPVDPARVYATGMSNGGMMAHKIGIMLSGRVAAIAPVVATLFGDEARPTHPVSALMLNGMLDESVPVQGGPPGGRFKNAWDGRPTQPARQQAAFWAEANECESLSEQDDRGAFVRSRYRCPAGRAVELYLLRDSGHAWPGGQKGSPRGDEPSTALDATEVIWTFFKGRR